MTTTVRAKRPKAPPQKKATPRNTKSAKRATRLIDAAKSPAVGKLSQDNQPDVSHFNRDVLTFRKSKNTIAARRKEIDWPIDKLNVHPLNRDRDQEHVQRLTELIGQDGQRDAIECRVCPSHWAERQDVFCIPEGHLQILRGAHRWAACQAIGNDMVRVVIFADVDDVEALNILARSDDQKDWTLLDKARLAHAMLDDGMTQTDVAAQFGVDKGTVSHWVALGKLPKYWQEVTTKGIKFKKGWHKNAEDATFVMPTSWLRPLEPFADCEPALRIVFDQMVELFDEGEYRELETKQDFADHVKWCLREGLRPVDAKDKPWSRWIGGGQKKWGRLFPLDDDVEKKLGIVEVKIEGKTVRRATNVTLWNELQKPYDEKFRAGKIDSAGRAIKADTTKKGPPKDANGKPKKETAAQKKAREKREAEADRERRENADRVLEQRLAKWRQRVLRQQIAKRLKPGDWLAGLLFPIVTNLFQNDYRSWSKNVTVYAAGNVKGFDGWDSMTWLRYLLKGVNVDDDPVTDVEQLQCRSVQLLLWPVADKELEGLIDTDVPPMASDLCEIEAGVVEWAAWHAETGDILGQYWVASQKKGSHEHKLLEQALDSHTNDQLSDAAGKLLGKRIHNAAWRNAKRKGDRIETLLRLHVESRLAKPSSWLRAVKKAK